MLSSKAVKRFHKITLHLCYLTIEVEVNCDIIM